MNNIDALNLVNKEEDNLNKLFKEIDNIALTNQKKVLDAFCENKVSLNDMKCSSGYGYDDMARPKLSSLYKSVFNCEDAIVSPLITCGTHAIWLMISSVLKPNDVMLSVTGVPYDTLVDALTKKGNGGLADYNIEYKQIDMIGSKVDIEEAIKVSSAVKPKVIYLQRSRGYSTRSTLTIEYIKEVISKLKKASPNSLFLVDNCYGEFVSELEPTDVGADLMAGSLIKNAGGGLAPTGAYIAGRQDLINSVNARLTAPTLGNEVGSYSASYTPFFEGLFIAPHVVAGAIKGNLLLGAIAKLCGYKTSPETDHIPEDIIRTIEFGKEDKFIEFVQDIQRFSPVDSFAVPEAWDMPGYNSKVIMAAGTFVQGSSIEFSCDGPVKAPYIAYMQGGLTYEHVKLIAINMASRNI